MKFFSTHKKPKDNFSNLNSVSIPDHATLLNKYPTFSVVIKEINNTTAEFLQIKGPEACKNFIKKMDKIDNMADTTLLKMFSGKKPSESMDFFYLKDLKDEEITKSTRYFFYNHI